MFVKVLMFLLILVKASSAGGGEETCDFTYRTLTPLFNEFFDNVTVTQRDCVHRVEEAQAEEPDKNALTELLNQIKIDCMDIWTGYLMEVVTSIDETVGVDEKELLDIIVGGVRMPIDMPMKCVANELTSMFPSIMIANGEVDTRVNMIIRDDF